MLNLASPHTNGYLNLRAATCKNLELLKETPFLGTVANIEYSMGQGWDIANMPGDTSDQKWFHVVYPHTPLRGFENHPFLLASPLQQRMGETLKAL